MLLPGSWEPFEDVFSRSECIMWSPSGDDSKSTTWCHLISSDMGLWCIILRFRVLCFVRKMNSVIRLFIGSRIVALFNFRCGLVVVLNSVFAWDWDYLLDWLELVILLVCVKRYPRFEQSPDSNAKLAERLTGSRLRCALPYSSLKSIGFWSRPSRDRHKSRGFLLHLFRWRLLRH